MDKVAFYEEVILNDVFEKEATTKFKEVLQTGMLPGGGKASGKTKKILNFNMNDQSGNNRFQKPGVNFGGRTVSGPSFDSPTRNIRAAKKFKDYTTNFNLDERQGRLSTALMRNSKKMGTYLDNAAGVTRAQYN